MSQFKSNILLIYGSGGHNEQMFRLISKLKEINEINDFNFISLCDDDVKKIVSEIFFIVPTITDKFSYIKVLLKLPVRIFQIFGMCRKINKIHKIDKIISTGPGISILASLYFKFFTKAQIIHVESWSRFYSKSLTGRFLYRIADVFFVQNKELLSIYPNAKFKGRL